jgi:hypothetical protein
MLAAGHNAAVQIDTSIRGCTNTEPASQGSFTRGLTSKIHALVDANGLPAKLGFRPGEAHDNRLCPELPAGLQPRSMLLAVPLIRIS